MSDTFIITLSVVIGTCFGSYIVLKWVTYDGRRKSGFKSVDQAHEDKPKDHPLPLFCRDCGKTMHSVRSQLGFDVTTGNPSYSYQRACPDGTQNPNHHAGRAWPYCGNMVAVVGLSDAHNHTDEEPHADCPVCIDQMVSDKILTAPQAAEMYSKLGVSIPPTRAEAELRARMAGFSLKP